MSFLKNKRFTVSLFFFFSGLCFSTWGSRIPDLKQKLGLMDNELGMMLLILPIGSFAGLPIAGYLVEKIGSKKTLLYAAVIYSLTLAIIGLSYTFVPLVISIFLFGALGNIMNISVNTQAIIVQDIYKRTIMSSFHGLWSIAGFTGGIISTFVFSYGISTDIHMAVVAVLTVIVTLICFNNLPDDVFKPKEKQEGRFIKYDPFIFNLGIIAFCSMICEGCMFDWSGVYFKEVLKVDKGLITAGYVSFFAAMASARFIADRIINRIGDRNVLIISGFLIFAGLIISVLFPTIYVCIPGFLLVGLGVASVVPTAFSNAGKSLVYSPGVALAFVTSIGFFGFLLGPPIIGFLAHYSSLRISFLAIAVFGIAITVISFFQKSRVEQPVKS